MTEQIKVSEVSSILRQQLEGIHTSIKLEEVGTVLQVSDGVAASTGWIMRRRTSCFNSITGWKRS